MKSIRSILVAGILALVAMVPAFAQTYAYQNPTYLPTAQKAAASLSAPGDYAFQTSGIASTSFTISGTCTSLAGTFQISNNGGTSYTTAQAIPVAGGAVTSAVATGTYRVNTAGMTHARVHVTALTAACSFAAAGTTAEAKTYAVGDVCQNPDIVKSSAVISGGAAATTAVLDTSTTTTIYVCSFSATLSGTTPTVVFKTGTQASSACDTGAASLTGVFAPLTGTSVSLSGPGTLFKSAAGGQLCVTTVGTGSTFNGVLTYVRQ